MYKKELGEASLNKYLKMISHKIKTLEKQIDNTNKKLDTISKLEGMTINIENICTNIELFTNTFPMLDQNLKLLNYFYNMNVTDIEQVSLSLETIALNVKSLIKEKDNLLSEKENIVSQINKLNNALSNNLEIKEVLSIMEIIHFQDEDKLSLVAYLAFNSCKDTVIKKEENIDSFVLDKCNKLREEANELITFFYDRISTKTSRQINYALSIGKFIKDTNTTIEYDEDKLDIYLFKLIEDKKQLEEEINSDKPDKVIIDILIDYINEDIKFIKQMKDLNKPNEVAEEYKNLVFATNNQNLLFDIEDMDANFKKNTISLLNNMKLGQNDLKNKVLQTDNKTFKNKIYIRSSSLVSCSYMNIDDKHLLILAIGSRKKIFDETNYIINKYENNILKIINDIKNNTYDKSLQENLMNTLESKLKGVGYGY